MYLVELFPDWYVPAWLDHLFFFGTMALLGIAFLCTAAVLVSLVVRR